MIKSSLFGKNLEKESLKEDVIQGRMVVNSLNDENKKLKT
jgi:hypothetical protein